jgi:tetratricopeptide (TPR) repeat protein
MPVGLGTTLQNLFERVVPSPVPENNSRRAIIDWLHAFIRLNIKRGPVFDLKQALRLHHADCLAYCKLFTVLGRRMGLDTGVVDVIIDSGGRYVPHTAIMVKTKGRPRFVDLWYGARDIRHRRLGIRVKEGGQWIVKDLDYTQLKRHEVNYLPDTYVDGVTLYVLGNQHLARGEFTQAIDCYTRAITLYPESIRPFYNRAIAYEKLGELQKAEEDYGTAFADENALIRTMAREHDEITDLMRLDEAEIEEEAQEMYLLRNGIITGRAVPLPHIATHFSLSEDKARVILHGVERRLKRAV